MTKQQITILVGLLLVSVLSVGAFLMSDGSSRLAETAPDPNLLPAAPAAPPEPPVVWQEQQEATDATQEALENQGASVGTSPFGIPFDDEIEDVQAGDVQADYEGFPADEYTEEPEEFEGLTGEQYLEELSVQ